MPSVPLNYLLYLNYLAGVSNFCNFTVIGMKFGVVIFPGSNCDQDMVDALANDLKQEVIKLWHKDSELPNFTTEDCVVLPGGFSYGDYLRCGALASQSPIMQAVKKHAANGGKVLGVCNGFQILCESGLLPGALLLNDTQKFECKNVYLKKVSDTAPISKSLGAQALKIPIAHGEGRYQADAATMQSLRDNDQVIFEYCNEAGESTDAANPNGSMQHIAGICNKGKNVFGMMPHPERATNAILGNIDGLAIFNSLILN
jgi:phosphoribosylformylglycinamidine synthase subunit PurQ / glutaminase